jgi:hypothetical protein
MLMVYIMTSNVFLNTMKTAFYYFPVQKKELSYLLCIADKITCSKSLMVQAQFEVIMGV